jgi:hypothetical protein
MHDSAIQGDRAGEEFFFRMRITAPGFAALLAKLDELEERRERLEQELSRIPGISARLVALAEERKHSELRAEDAELFRSAQYLASLRISLLALRR